MAIDTTFRFREDIVGKDQVLICKTQADADAANALGFPAVAFNLNMLREPNISELCRICRLAKYPYIVGEEKDQNRSVQIAIKLSTEGLAVFLVDIPDGNQLVSDDHLEQFLASSGAAKFRELMNSAPSFMDRAIGVLPENYQKAAPLITDRLAPLMAKHDAVSKNYFVEMIAKKLRVKAAIIKQLLAKAISAMPDPADSGELEEEQLTPEIVAQANELARIPDLFMRRIDAINLAGVVGERKNIAIIFCTLDSRLLLDHGVPGQNVLATKIAGHQGSGKSYTLMMSLQLYPKSKYLLITSGSERSLYHLERGIKHKCLIVMEAFQLSANRDDNEITYAIRTLLSEGKLSRLTTVKNEEGQWVARETCLEGPVSFITTTIESGLEAQLEDRIMTIHPDESISQTKLIVQNRAEQISGNRFIQDYDENLLWKAFHASLEPVSVVIPFASGIASFLTRSTVLPINARRAFNKVLNIIQAVTCFYQFQRVRDAADNLVATIPDYFMALQIVYETFKENLGQLPKATDLRLDYITTVGHVSPKNLAIQFGVTRSAISMWIKRLEGDGLLKWVDDQGKDFPDDKAMSLAKRTGKAHIQISGQASNPWGSLGLPSPFDLTNDPSWEVGGFNYARYDLRLDDVITVAQMAPASIIPVVSAQVAPVNNFQNNTTQMAPASIIPDVSAQVPPVNNFQNNTISGNNVEATPASIIPVVSTQVPPVNNFQNNTIQMPPVNTIPVVSAQVAPVNFPNNTIQMAPVNTIPDNSNDPAPKSPSTIASMSQFESAVSIEEIRAAEAKDLLNSSKTPRLPFELE